MIAAELNDPRETDRLLLIDHHLASVANIVDQLCLINHKTGLFAAGPAAELLSADKLSELYQHPIEVQGQGERLSIFAREAPHG